MSKTSKFQSRQFQTGLAGVNIRKQRDLDDLRIRATEEEMLKMSNKRQMEENMGIGLDSVTDTIRRMKERDGMNVALVAPPANERVGFAPDVDKKLQSALVVADNTPNSIAVSMIKDKLNRIVQTLNSVAKTNWSPEWCQQYSYLWVILNALNLPVTGNPGNVAVVADALQQLKKWVRLRFPKNTLFRNHNETMKWMVQGQVLSKLLWLVLTCVQAPAITEAAADCMCYISGSSDTTEDMAKKDYVRTNTTAPLMAEPVLKAILSSVTHAQLSARTKENMLQVLCNMAAENWAQRLKLWSYDPLRTMLIGAQPTLFLLAQKHVTESATPLVDSKTATTTTPASTTTPAPSDPLANPYRLMRKTTQLLFQLCDIKDEHSPEDRLVMASHPPLTQYPMVLERLGTILATTKDSDVANLALQTMIHLADDPLRPEKDPRQDERILQFVQMPALVKYLVDSLSTVATADPLNIQKSLVTLLCDLTTATSVAPMKLMFQYQLLDKMVQLMKSTPNKEVQQHIMFSFSNMAADDNPEIIDALMQRQVFAAAVAMLKTGPLEVVQETSWVVGNCIDKYYEEWKKMDKMRFIVLSQPELVPNLIHATTLMVRSHRSRVSSVYATLLALDQLYMFDAEYRAQQPTDQEYLKTKRLVDLSEAMVDLIPEIYLDRVDDRSKNNRSKEIVKLCKKIFETHYGHKKEELTEALDPVDNTDYGGGEYYENNSDIESNNDSDSDDHAPVQQQQSSSNSFVMPQPAAGAGAPFSAWNPTATAASTTTTSASANATPSWMSAANPVVASSAAPAWNPVVASSAAPAWNPVVASSAAPTWNPMSNPTPTTSAFGQSAQSQQAQQSSSFFSRPTFS